MQTKIIENLFSNYECWVIRPIREDVRKYRSRNQFISFIVFSVVIDNLASIRYLGELPDTPQESNVGKRYRRFIKEYMPSKYKKYAHLLYDSFRCKLVHKFQLEYFDIRQNRQSRKLHLKKVEKGKVCLNSQEFLNDLLYAFNKLKRDMLGKKAKKEVIEAFQKASYKQWYHIE